MEYAINHSKQNLLTFHAKPVLQPNNLVFRIIQAQYHQWHSPRSFSARSRNWRKVSGSLNHAHQYSSTELFFLWWIPYFEMSRGDLFGDSSWHKWKNPRSTQIENEIEDDCRWNNIRFIWFLRTQICLIERFFLIHSTHVYVFHVVSIKT